MLGKVPSIQTNVKPIFLKRGEKERIGAGLAARTFGDDRKVDGEKALGV
jgi:hypothetical protein